MSPVLPLLTEMRGRLAMYLGASSLVRLAAFLRGYDLAAERFGGSRDPFLSEFRDWIHERFGSSQHSWEETILLQSANDAEAVQRFWELLDEFNQYQQREDERFKFSDANGTTNPPAGSRISAPSSEPNHEHTADG